MSATIAEPPSMTVTPPKVGIISASDMLLAMVAVLGDRLPPKLDALFLHGSCIRDPRVDDIILAQAAHTLLSGGTKCIVINGIDDMPGAYPGAQAWRNKLAALGVQDSDVLAIPEADRTAYESSNLLDMAEERGWEEIAISSTPHHQLRCFLQLIAEMQKRGGWKHVVYNRPTRGVSWDMSFSKPSIDPTVATVTGNLEVHGALEFTNLGRYMVPFEDREGITRYTPHATISEMFEYLRWRDEGVQS